MLVPVALLAMPAVLGSANVSRIFRFVVGTFAGFFVGLVFIRGRFSVFLHELRHSVVSSLAGNRAKAFKYKNQTGSFEYQYSSATAHFNALIALAPYFLPIFTVAALGVGLAIFLHRPENLVLLIGVGYGIDLIINLRDAGPHQSDLTELIGGYPIGMLFIVLINTAIFCLLFAWVCQGVAGLQIILAAFWTIGLQIQNSAGGMP